MSFSLLHLTDYGVDSNLHGHTRTSFLEEERERERMWRSVVAARAAVSSRQGGAVWRRFYATQNPKHKVAASSSSKTQTQTESTKWGFPKRLFICQNPRFYSQTSTNLIDF